MLLISISIGKRVERSRRLKSLRTAWAKEKPLIKRLCNLIKVVPQGFEPQPAEPKSDVLPLHHGTILKRFVKSNAKV